MEFKAADLIGVPDMFLNEEVTLQVDGEPVKKTVREWCKERKLKPKTVHGRRHKACNWEEAFRPLEPKKAFRNYAVKFPEGANVKKLAERIRLDKKKDSAHTNNKSV